MTTAPTIHSEVPQLKDEIDRKAFEQLERLAVQLEHGKISPAQFQIGIDTVWYCVSGLASEWVIQAIGEIKAIKKEESFKDRRLFVGRKNGAIAVLILTRALSGDALALRSIPTGDSADWSFSCRDNPAHECLLMQNKVTDKLIEKGWRQL